MYDEKMEFSEEAQNQCLYNINIQAYSNKNEKKKAMEYIADKMNMSVDKQIHVYAHFINSCYTKKLKPIPQVRQQAFQ